MDINIHVEHPENRGEEAAKRPKRGLVFSLFLALSPSQKIPFQFKPRKKALTIRNS